MRMIRRLALVTAVSGALAVGTAGAAGADIISISGGASGASVNVLGGTIVLPATPSVTLPPGGHQSQLGVSVPGILSAGVLNVGSQGSTGPNGSASSQASVANASVLPPVLSAAALTSQCSSSEVGTGGSSSLLGANVAGNPVAVNPGPNTEIPLIIGNLALNEQQGGPNNIRVRAAHASTVAGDVVLAESACGVTLGGNVASSTAAQATGAGNGSGNGAANGAGMPSLAG